MATLEQAAEGTGGDPLAGMSEAERAELIQRIVDGDGDALATALGLADS